MKQKRKGFTLVELVIVIAVIAILAGVMIAVFANVVKKANESAKLQDEKQAEIQQKLDDIEKKLTNENWLGWEDFENELAEQIGKIEAGQLTQSEIEAAIDTAIKQYAGSDTALTEAQVKAIIERALSGQLTAAQVETIVKKYTDGTGLTASQVQKIVNAAMANQLTAAQVTQLMKNLVEDDFTNLDTKLSTLITDVKTLEVKIDDLGGKIESAMNDTVARLNTRVGITGAKTVVEAVAAAAEIGIDLNTLDMENIVWDEESDQFVTGTSSVNQWLFVKSGAGLSSVYSNYLQGTWTGDITTSTGIAVGENQNLNVTLSTTEQRTVDVYTNGGTLTVNAPNATVNHYGTAMMVRIDAVNMASYHLYGKVIGNIVLKAGRVVAEAGSSASVILADAADSAVIRIEVAGTAKVGSVAATSTGVLTAENTAISATATVKVETAVNAEAAGLFAGGLGTQESPYLIETAEQFYKIANLSDEMAKKTPYYFKQIADIVVNKRCADDFCGSYNGDGHSITAASNISGTIVLFGYNGWQSEYGVRGDVIIENLTTYSTKTCGIALVMQPSFEVQLIIRNVNTKCVDNVTFESNITNFGFFIVGAIYDETENSTLAVTFENCNNYASISTSGTNAAAFIGYGVYTGKVIMKNCSNYGTIEALKYAGVITGNPSVNMDSDATGTFDIIENVKNYGTIRAQYAHAFAWVDGGDNAGKTYNDLYQNSIGGTYLQVRELPGTYTVYYSNGIFTVNDGTSNSNGYIYNLQFSVNAINTVQGVMNGRKVTIEDIGVATDGSTLNTDIHAYDYNAAMEKNVIDSSTSLDYKYKCEGLDVAFYTTADGINYLIFKSQSAVTVDSGVKVELLAYTASGDNIGYISVK